MKKTRTTKAVKNRNYFTINLKPLSQLVHDRLKTLSITLHDRSLSLHDRSHSLYVFFRSQTVAPEFWACLKFRCDRLRSKKDLQRMRLVVQRSCALARLSHDFIRICNCGWVYFATMRLLHDRSQIILQRCTIIIRFPYRTSKGQDIPSRKVDGSSGQGSTCPLGIF